MKSKLFKTTLAAFLFLIPVSGFGQTAPNLNTAAEFAILAGTGISFAPPESEITNMDVGLHPGKLVSITGLENLNLVDGKILAEDEDPQNRLVDAKQHLVDAYIEAADAASDATISDNQGGETLTAGVYTSGESVSIEGAPLYLDAEGDPDAVWIFQIGSTLTTTSGGDVILTGGAQAKNVYWQVGSSATLGSGTAFKGNILALESITMGTGAILDGRALARNGAVTFAGGGTMTNPDDEQEDLAITKTADPKTFSEAGDVIEYEIAVTNNSGAQVDIITVKDDLIGLEETIGSLADGATVTNTGTYTITLADVENGFFKNTATAEATGISVSANEVVIKEGLLITKVATQRKTYYAEGQVIDYDIVVENTGTDTVTFTVEDILTEEDWENLELGPSKSLILTTTHEITEADMDAGEVENTATALVDGDVVAEDTETVYKVDPPPPIPLSAWALVLAGLLIAGFVVFQYRRSAPKRV